MIKFNIYIIVICFFSMQFCVGQKERTQEEYLKEFHRLDTVILDIIQSKRIREPC